MRLFDRPQENERKGDAYEEKLRDLKAQKIRITRQIGEKFIEESAGKDMAATPYADLFASRILLQFKQAFRAGAFAVGSHSNFRSEALSFFYKLGSRAGVQTVRSGNGNFLLEHCISPTYRFSVVELKSSLAVRL